MLYVRKYKRQEFKSSDFHILTFVYDLFDKCMSYQNKLRRLSKISLHFVACFEVNFYLVKKQYHVSFTEYTLLKSFTMATSTVWSLYCCSNDLAVNEFC